MKYLKIIFPIVLLVILALMGLSYFSSNSKTTTNPNSNSLAQFSKDDWRLILVNNKTGLPEGYEDRIQFGTINFKNDGQGTQFDKRALKDAQAFVDACNKISPNFYIVSTYRSYDQQALNYQSAGGANQNPVVVNPPGHSEHETGLAIDITCSLKPGAPDNQNFNDASVKVQMEKMWAAAPKYGFIHRYPEGDSAEKSTGVSYEDWHMRYVGKTAAEYITKNNLTLEQFVARLNDK